MIEGIIKLKLTNEDRSMLENNNIVEYEFFDPLLGTLDIQISKRSSNQSLETQKEEK